MEKDQTNKTPFNRNTNSLLFQYFPPLLETIPDFIIHFNRHDCRGTAGYGYFFEKPQLFWMKSTNMLDNVRNGTRGEENIDCFPFNLLTLSIFSFSS